MIKKLNVLVLDDNKIIVESLTKRIQSSAVRNLEFTNLQIVVHHLELPLQDDQQAAGQIKAAIKTMDIDILLLDREFHSIIDPKVGEEHSRLNGEKLYLKKHENSKKIEDILARLQEKDFHGVSGVIVYTYLEPDSFEESGAIRARLEEILGDKFDRDAIEVIQTNLEIYQGTGRKLYVYEDVPAHEELESIGEKGEFVLYGRFMGEILYNRIVSLRKIKRYGKLFLAKTALMQRNTILLFLVFTGLNIGATIMCDILKEKINRWGLLAFGVVLAIGLPLSVLWKKPEWVVTVDD